MLDRSMITNSLLATLGAEDFAMLGDGAVEVDLPLHLDLGAPGVPLTYAWFVTAGIVSVIAADADDNHAEVGLIGPEGVGDVGSVLGDRIGTARLLVQVPGRALRVRVDRLQSAMARSPEVTRLMLAYARAHQTQINSSALAFAKYSLERRLARWLLMCSDRTEARAMPLTHDILAIMLGVRRAGVTVALAQLVASGAIGKGRGVIAVRSREILLHHAGAGYGEAEAVYERLIGDPRQFASAAELPQVRRFLET